MRLPGLLIALAMLSPLPSALAEDEPLILTRSAVLAAADAEAAELGYDLERMSVSFDYHNTQWEQSKLRYIKSTPPPMVQQLTDRDFFAVYYGPLQPQMGGDLWVFIDRHTGALITTIRGK